MDERAYPEQGYGSAGWSTRGGSVPAEQQRQAGDGYRVPEPRHSDPVGWDPGVRYPDGRHGGPVDMPTGSVPQVSPVSVPPPGAQTDTGGIPRFRTEPIDRAALRRGASRGEKGGASRVGDGFYRTRRPALALAIALGVGAFEIPALRVLLTATVRETVSGPGVVAGTLLVLGLPLFGAGLYAVASGAGKVPDGGGNPVLRPPLAYLIVALVLFVAAGLAAG